MVWSFVTTQIAMTRNEAMFFDAWRSEESNNDPKTKEMSSDIAAMATKKQKAITMPPDDVLTSADKCAQAIETALEAMDPPIDVHAGILRFIAGFAQYGRPGGSATEFFAVYSPITFQSEQVHFDTNGGGGPAHFQISNEGMTATRMTRIAEAKYTKPFICASPPFSSGIHETSFSIALQSYFSYKFAVGVVLAVAKTSSTVGHWYRSDGTYLISLSSTPARGTEPLLLNSNRAQGSSYRTGDVITVRLDLRTNTVTFHKNGMVMGSPKKIVIPSGGDRRPEWHFAVDAYCQGDAVTIVDAGEASSAFHVPNPLK